LIERLRALGLRRLDFILLTHIHIDHAGAAAALQRAFPEARVHSHPKGAPHVEDPRRLWKGSLAVLGDVARCYGEPPPLPGGCLVAEEQLAQAGITVLPTPGHAPHHVSFLQGEDLFLGEAFGTRIPLPSGQPYLRPATPPRFLPAVHGASIERLLALEPQPRRAVFAHYGAVEGLRPWAELAQAQTARWTDWAAELLAESERDLLARFTARVLREDPLCGGARHAELDQDLRQRELGFFANSLDGILGWLRR